MQMFRVSGNAKVTIGTQVLCADGYVSVLQDRILKTYMGNSCSSKDGKIFVDGRQVSNNDERYVAVTVVNEGYRIPADYHQHLVFRNSKDLCRDDEFLRETVRAMDGVVRSCR